MLDTRNRIVDATSKVNSNKVIYVYSDCGVSATSLGHTLHTLEDVTTGHKFELIDAEGIVNKAWTQDAALLIMPGGADVPYAQKLNGSGNNIIQQYVENGGGYLGICAGAYYGTSFVEFDKHGPLEVVGERALKFFPGKAIGPILAPYDDVTNRGARAASIRINWKPPIKQPMPNTISIYYNGGGYFEAAEACKNVNIIASYQLEDNTLLPAILKIRCKQGTVILSGIHFEYSAQLLKKDQYHDRLIPSLKNSENDRMILASAIFSLLGVDTKMK